jgi:hypothetical protein
MAWTRRDFAVGPRSAAARVMAASAQPSAGVSTAAVVATPPSTLTSAPTGWVTGQRNTAYPGLTWAQINNTAWANVYGTDVGAMWVNGDNGLTQLAFGDTFSGPNMSGNWRSNVLLLSSDTELYDGLTLIDTGPAFQFIPAARNQVFFIGSEVTNIPSAAVYALAAVRAHPGEALAALSFASPAAAAPHTPSIAAAPLWDVLPAHLVSLVVTNAGAYAPAGVGRLADELYGRHQTV